MDLRIVFSVSLDEYLSCLRPRNSFLYVQNMASQLVAYRLKKLRRSRGLSQRGASQLLGVRPTQLMLWEQGKRMPEGKNLFKLGALYNSLIEDLYYELRQEAIQEIKTNVSTYGYLGTDRPAIRSP